MGRSGVEKIYTLVKKWRFRRNLFSGDLYRRANEHDRVKLTNRTGTVTVVTIVRAAHRARPQERDAIIRTVDLPRLDEAFRVR